MPQRVLVDFEGSDLPVGEVIAANGRRIAFTGWIELAAALEASRFDAAAEDGSLGGPPRE